MKPPESECNWSSVIARIAVLENLIPERFRAQEKALELQTEELARRLDDLNGEAERLRSMQATYLPREVYDTKQVQIDRALHNLQMFQSNLTGRMAILVSLGSLFGGTIAAILTAVVVRWMAS